MEGKSFFCSMMTKLFSDHLIQYLNHNFCVARNNHRVLYGNNGLWVGRRGVGWLRQRFGPIILKMFVHNPFLQLIVVCIFSFYSSIFFKHLHNMYIDQVITINHRHVQWCIITLFWREKKCVFAPAAPGLPGAVRKIRLKNMYIHRHTIFSICL